MCVNNICLSIFYVNSFAETMRTLSHVRTFSVYSLYVRENLSSGKSNKILAR